MKWDDVAPSPGRSTRRPGRASAPPIAASRSGGSSPAPAVGPPTDAAPASELEARVTALERQVDYLAKMLLRHGARLDDR